MQVTEHNHSAKTLLLDGSKNILLNKFNQILSADGSQDLIQIFKTY